MIKLGVTVTGAQETSIKFDRFPDEMREALYIKIEGQTAVLEDRILFRVPRGKTGALARSIKRDMFDDKNKVVGRVTVDADFVKAAAIEWGVHSAFEQGSYDVLRQTVFSRRLLEPVLVTIERHTRNVNIVAARFERGALEEAAPGIETELRATVDAEVGKMNQ